MKTFILIILVGSIMNSMFSVNHYFNNIKSYGYQIRNTGLRIIIFKEKKYPKLLYKIKEIYEFCNIKTYNLIYDQICYYNSLSEDDKLLLDIIGSLLY